MLPPAGSSRPVPPPTAASPAPAMRAPVDPPLPSAGQPTPPGALAAPKSAPESGARTRSLAQEIASLDHVRKLLGAGDAAQALRALRRHARGYPQGALQQEAELLQIEALTRAGEPAQARARAAQFLTQHPDSPHGPRVRSLLAGADGAP
jgi:TolA-binding protein